MKALSADVSSMEAAKDHVFTSPPRAWIADRITRLNDLLAKRTEQSALALRRLTGPVTLTPKKPEVGRPYFQAACRFDSLNLLVSDGGSNLLQWWRRRPAKTCRGMRKNRGSREARGGCLDSRQSRGGCRMRTLARVHALVRTHVPTLGSDRAPSRDINEISRLIESGEIDRACAMEVN